MRLAVVGGGAAGMMASVFAAEKGAVVDLYERNEKLGKKMRRLERNYLLREKADAT